MHFVEHLQSCGVAPENIVLRLHGSAGDRLRLLEQLRGRAEDGVTVELDPRRCQGRRSRRLGDIDRGAADPQRGTDSNRCRLGDPTTVEQGPVPRTEVLDQPLATFAEEAGVSTRHGSIGHRDFGVRRPTHNRRIALGLIIERHTRSGHNMEQDRHDFTTPSSFLAIIIPRTVRTSLAGIGDRGLKAKHSAPTALIKAGRHWWFLVLQSPAAT